ncbi:hypothetical protein CCAE64S_02437 [Castellaniella caeni]
MVEAARARLTPGRIAAFDCPEGVSQAFLWDAVVPGMALRAAAKGRKTFIFQGRLEGKSLRMTIGDAESWTLELARRRAREIQGEIDSGRDPRVVKQERTAADEIKRAEAEASKAPAAEAWATYMEHCSTRQKRPWSARTHQDHERLADPGGKPKTRGRKKGEGETTQPGALHGLLQLPLVKIDADAIESWLKENSYRPAVAEFGFARLRAFTRWCARQKAYRGQVDTQAFGDDNVKEQVPELKARTDRLRRSDLRAWFAAVRGLGNPVHAAYLQITLLTGCRRGELAPLRWDDGVDFAHNALHLDGKTGPRVIPMPPYIRALLVDLKKRNQAGPNIVSLDGTRPAWKPSPFVFPSQTAKSGYVEEPRYSHEKALQAAGVPHVSIHGLRRTFGSMSDAVGVDLPHGVVLQIQGHKPQGVAEQHYRVRELEELAPWHAKYEAWILGQAGIEQPKVEDFQPKAVTAA